MFSVIDLIKSRIWAATVRLPDHASERVWKARRVLEEAYLLGDLVQEPFWTSPLQALIATRDNPGCLVVLTLRRPTAIGERPGTVVYPDFKTKKEKQP